MYHDWRKSEITRQRRNPERNPLRGIVVNLPRRQFLHLAAGAAALPLMSPTAGAQAYPTRPVRLVVGFPAGGANDIYARLIADWLSKRFGYSFIVEDRPGAASNIAAESVVRAPADGYTLLEFSTTNASIRRSTPTFVSISFAISRRSQAS